MQRPLLVSICALPILAACAAAMPGYVPDKGRIRLAEKAKQEPPAAATDDGSYVLTDKERGYNCRRLTGVLQIKIQQLRSTPAEPLVPISATTEKILAPPSTAGHLRAGSQARARIEALNRLMIEKKCGHFDLDAALDPASTGTPEPIGGEKRGKSRR